MKRRFFTFVLTAALLLNLCACGSAGDAVQKVAAAAKELTTETTAPAEETTTATEETTAATEKPTTEPRALTEAEKDLYCGKWVLAGLLVQEKPVWFDDLIASGMGEETDFNSTQLNLTEDGTASLGENEEKGNWVVTEDGISVSGGNWILQDGLLILSDDDGLTLVWEKTHDRNGNAIKSTLSASEPTEEEKAICGKWEPAKYVENGKEYTIEELIKNGGSENLRTAQFLVFRDGIMLLSYGDSNTWCTWSKDGDAITIGDSTWPMKSGFLSIPQTGGGEIYYQQVADWQWNPIEIQTVSTGLRPEFKEAMDAYEAFYDEYIALLQDYTKNPTNLSILTKYMNMISKLEEIDAAFKEWESEDLNDEELMYYLEVSSRIAKKLLDAM